MQPLSLDAFDAIIFDLGGVLLELDTGRTVAELSRLLESDASSLYTRLKQVTLFDEYERGEISDEEFRRAILKTGPPERSDATPELDAAWNAMLGPIPRQNVELLKKLKQKKRTFVLSNTNAIHVRCFREAFERDHDQGPFESFFEEVHYSHELGMRKPESRAYQALIARHALKPERTVFIDDNPANVEAASAVGLIGVFHESNSPLRPRFPELLEE